MQSLQCHQAAIRHPQTRQGEGGLMQSVIVAALLILLPAGAVGQEAQSIEAVTVTNNSLAGVWKIVMPEGFKGALLGKTEWGQAIDAYCRIEEIHAVLTVHCPGLGMTGTFIDRGAVTIDRSHIRIIWGSTFRRMGISGTLRSTSEFDGTFFIERLGMSSDAPIQTAGRKLSLSESTGDKAGRSALLARLLQQLAQGAPTEALDTHAKTMRFPTPDELRPLGSIQTMIYLGEMTNTGDRPYSVYDVEFSNGNLICELRQSGDNTLDGFLCG